MYTLQKMLTTNFQVDLLTSDIYTGKMLNIQGVSAYILQVKLSLKKVKTKY